MSHTRIRKFNTKDAYPEQSLDNDVCMAVRAGNTVYLRGQTAMDLDGKIVGIGDAAAQTENAMKCAKMLLEEAAPSLRTSSRSQSTLLTALIASRYIVSLAMAERRVSGVDRHHRQWSRQA